MLYTNPLHSTLMEVLHQYEITNITESRFQTMNMELELTFKSYVVWDADRDFFSTESTRVLVIVYSMQNRFWSICISTHREQ